MRQLNRIAVLVLALVLAGLSFAQSDTVEGIEIQGLFRMTREAFLHAFDVKVGDPYDVDKVRRQFRELWKLGLFEDIKIESEPGENGGVVLVIKVKERPVLTSVTYDEVKAVTRTEIEDRLKEADIRLQLGRPMDMGRVFRAKTAIKDLLAEKGFLDAQVDTDVRKVTETSRAVHFSITPGGKTRIRKIDFVGNALFKDRKLKSQLRLTQERKWYWPWSKKNLYHPAKWDQDVAGVRDLYQNAGYLDVEVRAPVIDVRTSKKAARKAAARQAAADAAVAGGEATGAEPVAQEEQPTTDESALTPRQQQKLERKRARQEKRARRKARKASKIKRWVELTVPVVEGEQYRLGKVSFSGNEVFPENLLRTLIRMNEGDIFHNDRLENAVDAITLLYEDRGHLYATVVRRIERREDERIADVEINIEEDKAYYVARIEFRGNTQTHDRVLRREMLLNEGDLFSRTRLDFSRSKVNQLGYFQVPDEPIIEPIEGESRVNITMPGEEAGRNEIQVGGGYSGLEGAFFNGVYSTRNFLGRGQTLSAALQIGGRSNRYQISFQEPWFLSRPIRLGFSLFRRDLDYGATLNSTSTGGGVVIGKLVGRFTNINVGYNWENVSSTTVLTTAGGVTGDFSQTITTQNTVSSLTPVYSYNTINNPYRPTRGRSFTLSFQIAGGPLGGDTSFLKPIASFVNYLRAPGKGHFGFNLQAGLVRQWQGGSSIVSGSNVEGVPRFQRFWLGGETLGPRAFETRSITPLRYVVLDSSGRIERVLGDPRYLSVQDVVNSGGIPVPIEVGGDRYFLFQSEYVYPFNEQAEIALFFDVGDALFEDQSFGFDTARASAGLELRFHLPIFPVPLRLIYGVPVRKLNGDRTSNFTFSIGRSF